MTFCAWTDPVALEIAQQQGLRHHQDEDGDPTDVLLLGARA
jgi:hypothetical protein